MAVLSRLLNELVFFVVEHACREYDYAQPAWVASLCLVCKSVQHIVTPILYARLFISTKSIGALEELCCTDKNRRLSLVREAHISGALDLGDDTMDGAGCIVYSGISLTLARALDGVQTVCGPSWSVESLNPNLAATVSSLHVKFEVSVGATWLGHSPAHLGIIYCTTFPFATENLSPLRGTGVMLNCLVFDVTLYKAEVTRIQAQYIAHYTATLNSVMDTLSSYLRVLFCPRCDMLECTEFVITLLTAWARGRKDARIWVDDAFVPLRC